MWAFPVLVHVPLFPNFRLLGYCLPGWWWELSCLFFIEGQQLQKVLMCCRIKTNLFYSVPVFPYAKKLSGGEKCSSRKLHSESPFLMLLGSHLRWKLEPIVAHLITQRMSGMFNGNGKSSNMCEISSSCISRHVTK